MKKFILSSHYFLILVYLLCSLSVANAQQIYTLAPAGVSDDPNVADPYLPALNAAYQNYLAANPDVWRSSVSYRSTSRGRNLLEKSNYCVSSSINLTFPKLLAPTSVKFGSATWTFELQGTATVRGTWCSTGKWTVATNAGIKAKNELFYGFSASLTFRNPRANSLGHLSAKMGSKIELNPEVKIQLGMSGRGLQLTTLALVGQTALTGTVTPFLVKAELDTGNPSDTVDQIEISPLQGFASGNLSLDGTWQKSSEANGNGNLTAIQLGGNGSFGGSVKIKFKVPKYEYDNTINYSKVYSGVFFHYENGSIARGSATQIIQRPGLIATLH